MTLTHLRHETDEKRINNYAFDTVVAVLVEVAVLDLMGLTDVYPFINPIELTPAN